MPQTTNSITPNKLTVPDLISVGVFTALYFVLVTVATFTCALLPGVGNIVLPALAALISESELSEDYIIPKAFDHRVGPAVAKAVAEAARRSGVARI